MCGIIGYVGKEETLPILINGLKKLEYRGYDSTGITIRNHYDNPIVIKSNGKLDNLINKTNNKDIHGFSGIGHTRWATHGNGIHGFGKNNEFEMIEGLSKNKWQWIKCRLLLTDKNYRKALFPKLGSKAILYPICLIIHWIKLVLKGLFRRIKILFRILFRKNKKKELYKKLGI